MKEVFLHEKELSSDKGRDRGFTLCPGIYKTPPVKYIESYVLHKFNIATAQNHAEFGDA